MQVLQLDGQSLTLGHVRAFAASGARVELAPSARAAMLRSVDGFTPRLRFPYLKEGESVEERDAVRRWMAQSGYVPEISGL